MHPKDMFGKVLDKLADNATIIATGGGFSTAVQGTDFLTNVEKHATAWLSIVVLAFTLYGKIRKNQREKHKNTPRPPAHPVDPFDGLS